MSEHREIVRDYISLRNFLAQNNPRPDMPFEILFAVENHRLVAINSVTKAKVQLADLQKTIGKLQVSGYGFLFAAYSEDLVDFINPNLNSTSLADTEQKIAELASIYQKSLNLDHTYEPRN